MESNVDSINKDVDLFKLRMNDMPLHMSPFGTHMKWDFHGDHHGGAPWQHMNLSWWTRVWLPNSFYEQDHEILGSGLETSGACLGTTLSVTPQKPFETTLCHPAFPSGQLNVVPWEFSRQLEVIHGVTLCGWATSYNGGQWVSRPWNSKKFTILIKF
jgi:hypothetical protein